MYKKLIKKHYLNLALLGISGFLVLIGILTLLYSLTPLPNVDELDSIYAKQSTVLTSRDGEFLFDFSENERRSAIKINDVPEHLKKAVIAVEDQKFYEHGGIHLPSFLRALLINVQTLSFAQGGSTITQQVIKNTFLTGEKKIQRKLKEFILAPKLEAELSKEEILEIYLNTIAYGGTIYGLGEASNSFFNKQVADLTLAESTYLAAIPNAPTRLSPYGANATELENRKNLILEKLLETNEITREEYKAAIDEKVFFEPQARFSIKAPHFVFFVKEKLEEKYGGDLSALEGSVIKSTLDYELQQKIEEHIEEFAPTIDEKHGAKNLAAVVLSTKTGEILSMVGSLDFFDAEIDGSVNIINSLRQPGSTFKPFIYSLAFEKGLLPETKIFDVQTQFSALCEKDFFESTDECYSPVNYDGVFRGPISLRNALAQSINIPAVKTLYLVGVNDIVRKIRDYGITTLNKDHNYYGLSLVLGAGEVKPIELASAYSVFANEGIYTPYKYLLDDKKTLQTTKRVISKKIARNINSILSDKIARAPVFGLNSPISFEDIKVATKTGTTNNSRDIWIVSYTPDIVVLLWAGNAKGDLLFDNAAGFSLAPLLRSIFDSSFETYGSYSNIFLEDTEVKERDGLLGGEFNEEYDEAHSILHFTNRRNLKSNKSILEDDQQYLSWEYGISNWFGNEEYRNSLDESYYNYERIEDFSPQILFPSKDLKINLDSQTIIVNRPSVSVSNYEFYANNRLIGSSSIPLITFIPKNFVSKGDRSIKIKIRIVSSIGIFEKVETFDI